MAGLDAISAFGSAALNMLGLGLNESQNRRTNELDWKIAQDNLYAAEKLNTMNLDAARENWKREQSNFMRQRDWSLQDRAFENWYNSPAQQVARYLQAGLNPALMMEGQSSVGSATASQGQAPNFGSPPASIPERNEFRYIPMDYNGLGLGFDKAINTFLVAQKQESDISTANAKLYNESLDLIDKINNSDVDRRYKNELINSLKQNFQFAEDSKDLRLRNQKLQNDFLEKQAAFTDMQTRLNEKLAESTIQLNQAEKVRLGATVKECLQHIASMQNSDRLNSAEVSQRVISMINHDAAIFEQLGLSREMTSSQKFKNYVGSIVDAIGTSAAVYFGVRRGSAASPVPMQPVPYTNNLNGYAPWSSGY